MSMSRIMGSVVIVWLLAVSAGLAWGQATTPAGVVEKDPVAESSLPPDHPVAGETPAGGESVSPWFWFVCTSNYHNKLKTSERRIDRQVNNLFGAVLPQWRRVTTFQDWRDEYYIWDLSGGVGRDINPHLAWTVYGGGGMGTIRNRDDYHLLGMPADSKVYFTRKSLLAGVSLRWWPLGKPHKTEKGLWGSLKAARPVTEANVGYTRQISIADVRLWTPFTGDAIRIKQEDKFNLFWLSPRAGFEIPLGHDMTFNALGGYLFFHDQQDDFNGPMLEFFVSGRF